MVPGVASICPIIDRFRLRHTYVCMSCKHNFLHSHPERFHGIGDFLDIPANSLFLSRFVPELLGVSRPYISKLESFNGSEHCRPGMSTV